VDDAFALDVAGALRGFGLSIQKQSLALRATAFGLLAAAANQFDVTHGSVVAQMTGDGEIVHGPYRDFLAHYSARAPQVVSLTRQRLRTTIFFVSSFDCATEIKLGLNTILKSRRRSIFLTIKFK
jgi:hypothetical protein